MLSRSCRYCTASKEALLLFLVEFTVAHLPTTPLLFQLFTVTDFTRRVTDVFTPRCALKLVACARQPPGAVLHSPDEPGELSHDDSTIHIVPVLLLLFF